MLDHLRRRLARRISDAATSMAPRLPESAIHAAEMLIGSVGPQLPVLGPAVEKNLRSAGLYTPVVHRSYFQSVAGHFGNALRFFGASGSHDAVVRLAENHIDVNHTTCNLKSWLAEAGGLVIAPPHVCNYLLTLVRLNQVIPLTVYLRWSKDERKRALKERWCRAAGLQVILEAPNATDPTSRAMACVEAVRTGRALVMTPDLAQKAAGGVPVALLGRRVFLPSGPASIAMLAGVPFVPVFGRMAGHQHQIYTCEPIRVPTLARADGGRQAAIAQAMQRWTDCFESFLRHQPQMWFFWGDKRWTRVFHGDSRYVQALEADATINAVQWEDVA